MEQHSQRLVGTPAPGGDSGFLVRYGAALVGLGIIYFLRNDIVRFAANPQAARRAVESLAAWFVDYSAALLPLVALLLLAIAAAALLVVRLGSRPLSVPRLRPGERRIRMGRLLGGRRTYDVPKDGLFDHWLILGRSRFGTSHHAAGLARQYFDSRLTGLVLIDPHDELCRSFVAASYRAFGDRPVTWASFGRGDLCPGLNLLERLPDESPAQVAERFVSLIDWLYFAGESVDHQKCTNNLRLASWAVSSVGGFLPDLRVFLTNFRYRGWLTANTRDRFLLQAISEYNSNVSHDPGWPQSALNRLADLLDNEPLRRIVCQETTVDLRPALDRNGVLLVSLDESVLGSKGVFILAGLLLHQIAAHLKRRAKDDDFHQNPRVRLILDEAQSFEVGLLKGMIGELAGRGLALTLMTQGLSQFSDQKFFSYVTNNFGSYSVFAVSDEEAQPIARQLFAPKGNQVGAVDEYGRPIHYLSVPEQLADSSALLTQQLRREFVAKAYGQPPARCESFELRPEVDATEVEAFRRRELRRIGHSTESIEVALQARMQSLRELRQPAQAADNKKERPSEVESRPYPAPAAAPEPPQTPVPLSQPSAPPAKRQRSHRDRRPDSDQDTLM